MIPLPTICNRQGDFFSRIKQVGLAKKNPQILRNELGTRMHDKPELGNLGHAYDVIYNVLYALNFENMCIKF